jgi:hypothetical protein
MRDQLSFVATFRIENDVRLEYLRLTLQKTFAHLPRGLECQILDASPAAYQREVQKVVESAAGLDLRYEARACTLAEAWLTMFERARGRYVVPLFDDQPILKLDEDFLSSSCLALDTDETIDLALFLAASPSLSVVDRRSRTIFVVPAYNPFISPYGELEAVRNVGGRYVFVSRRPPTMMRFFFNNAIFRRDTFANSLRWFIGQFPGSSAAQLENLNHLSPAPFRRIAYTYGGAHVVDIDGTHTVASGRHGSMQDRLRQNLFEALEAGFDARCLAHDPELSSDTLAHMNAGDVKAVATAMRSSYYAARLRLIKRVGPLGLARYIFRNAADRGTWTRLRIKTAQLIPRATQGG